MRIFQVGNDDLLQSQTSSSHTSLNRSVSRSSVGIRERDEVLETLHLDSRKLGDEFAASALDFALSR